MSNYPSNNWCSKKNRIWFDGAHKFSLQVSVHQKWRSSHRSKSSFQYILVIFYRKISVFCWGPLFSNTKTLCLSSAESSEVSSQQRIASLGIECISEPFLKARHPWILGNKRNTFAVSSNSENQGGVWVERSIFSSVTLLKIDEDQAKGVRIGQGECCTRTKQWRTVLGSLAVMIDSSCNRRALTWIRVTIKIDVPSMKASIIPPEGNAKLGRSCYDFNKLGYPQVPPNWEKSAAAFRWQETPARYSNTWKWQALWSSLKILPWSILKGWKYPEL